MKKVLFILSVFLCTTKIFAATNENPFASYTQNTHTVFLSNESKILIFDNFKGYFKYNGTFLKTSIDDPEPLNSESNAYAIFDGNNIEENTWISVYFKLTKVIDLQNGIVKYFIDFSGKNDVTSKVSSGGGSCAGVGCSSCHKDRNWFLGPVVGCSCTTQATPTGFCNHNTGSGPDWWTVLMAILPFILP